MYRNPIHLILIYSHIETIPTKKIKPKNDGKTSRL